MANQRDINLAIIGEDLTRKATDGAAGNFDRLQRKVDGFSTKKPSKQIQDFGRLITSNLKDGESGFDAINRVIGETEQKADELRKAFATTGNVGVFGDLKGVEADLRFLDKTLTTMTGHARGGGADAGNAYGDEFLAAIPFGIGKAASMVGKLLTKAVSDVAVVGEDAGKTFADGFASGADAAAQDIPQLFTPQGAIGAAIVAGAGATLAAAVGGAVETGLTLGVGAGFIGIGALLERDNPRVLGAFTILAQDAQKVLAHAADPLVPSFEQALEKVDGLVVKEEPTLRKIFAAVSPAVDEIVNGLDRSIESITPKLVGVARFFTSMFADPTTKGQLVDIGHLIEDLFTNVTDHKQDTEDFFHGLLFLIGAAVGAVDALELAWDGLVAVWRASPAGMVSDMFGKIAGAIHGTDDAATQTTPALRMIGFAAVDAATKAAKSAPNWATLTQSLQGAADTADTFAGQAADKILNSLLSLDRGTLGFAESVTDLSKAMKTNKAALSLHTAAGQADRDAILAAVAANQQQYDSMIAAGMSADAATKSYDRNFSSLEKLPGLTDAQQKAVDKLIQKYKHVPDKVNTDISLGDLDDVLTDIDNLIRKLLGIDGTYTARVKIKIPNQATLDRDVRNLGHLSRYGYGADTSWSPVAPTPNAGVSTPPRTPNLTANLTSTLVLDGQVIDRRSQRVVAAAERRRRVGVRR